MTITHSGWTGTLPARRVRWGDGQDLVVRPATRDDAEGLAALYEGLDETRLSPRFLTAGRPDRRAAAAMAAVESRGGYRLVAVVEGAGEDARLVGEAGYDLRPDGTAEFGLATIAERRRKLSLVLLRSLLEVAESRGIATLQADLACTDTDTVDLARSLGGVLSFGDDPRFVRALVRPDGRPPAWPGAHDRPRVLVESSAGHWRGARAGAEAGMQVLVCSGPHDHRCPPLSGDPCPLAAGADAIVVSRPPHDPAWTAVHAAHRVQHPGVPVCVQHPRAGCTAPAGALTLPDDSIAAAATIGDVARRHALLAGDWLRLSAGDAR
jgi:hypothetical protein